MEILRDDEQLQSVLLGPIVEVKFLGDGLETGSFDGYGATFGGVDQVGDTIQPGAFSETLAQHHAAGTAPAMLWHHRGAEPIGKWTAMGEDARGLRVRGQLNLDTARGRDAHAHLKAGDVHGLSIGFSVPRGGQSRGPNGTRLLSNVHLHEVSVASMPADPRAKVTAIKMLGSRAEVEDFLRNAGLPRNAARVMAAPAWAALNGAQDEPAKPDPALVDLMKHITASRLELKSLKEKFK